MTWAFDSGCENSDCKIDGYRFDSSSLSPSETMRQGVIMIVDFGDGKIFGGPAENLTNRG